MSMIQEYLEERKNASSTPPKASKTYNRFFWWRRYQEHKFLPNRSPIWDKAKNGDYDVSPYWKQREWEYWFEEQELIKFRKEYKGSYQSKGWEERGVTKLFWERRKRLLKDAEKDEHNRWALFIKDVKGS